MATVAEKFQGVSGSQTQRRIEFIVSDCADESEAITATVVYLGANYPGLSRDSIPLQGIDVEELAWNKGLFQTTANFAVDEAGDPQTNDIEVSFDGNLDTRRIYRSYATTQYNENPSAPGPDSYGRINVSDMEDTQNATTEGVDVRIPVGGFTVTWYAPQASITESYRKTALDLVGKINNASFYGHAAGEVLFTGITGAARNADDWQLAYRFETSPNTTQTIGTSPHQITGISVGGWQHVWVHYKKDEENGENVQYPQSAYVDTIYESGDFSLLGIGT